MERQLFSPRNIIALVLSLVGGILLFSLLPESLRGRLPMLMVAVPILLAVLAFRRYYVLVFLTLITGITSPTISLGFANLYLHQGLILLASVSLGISHLLSLPVDRGNTQYVFPLFAVPIVISLLLSFPMAPHMSQAIKTTLYIGVLVCTFYITANTLQTWERTQQYLKIVFIGAMLTSFVALLQPVLYGRLVMTATLKNQNALGNFLMLGGSLWLGLHLMGRRAFRSRLAEYAGLGLVILVIFMTRSRAAWLGMLGASLTALSLDRRIRPRVVLAICLLLFLVGATEIRDIIEQKMTEKGFSGIEYRLRKIEMAFDMFQESPLLGKGPGSFEYRASRHPDPAIQRHTTLECTYPYVMAEFGILGLIAFGACLWLVVRIWLRTPRDRDHPKRVLANAILATMVGVLLVQIGENTLFFPKINWLIGALLGILKALSYPERAPAESPRHDTPALLMTWPERRK